MKKIGLSSASFTPEQEERVGGVNRRIAKWVMNVLLTGSLQGCDDGSTTSLTSPTSWTRPTWFWVVMTLCLVAVVLRMRFNMKRLQLDLNRYKAVWKGIRDTMKLTREQDPFCQDDFSCGAEGELGEEEELEEDIEELLGSNDEVRRRRQIVNEALHEAERPEEEDEEEENDPGFPDDPTPEYLRGEEGMMRRPGGAKAPALPPIAKAKAVAAAARAAGEDLPGGVEGDPSDDEIEETPGERRRRYQQSGMDEVSDPDLWCDIHYPGSDREPEVGSSDGERYEEETEEEAHDADGGNGDRDSRGSRSRSMSRESDRLQGVWRDPDSGQTFVPEAKAMPEPLKSSVRRRQAMDTAKKVQEMIERSGETYKPEEERFREAGEGGATSSSTRTRRLTEEHFHMNTEELMEYFNWTPVPRSEEELGDYRWEMLMQGIGPEHFLVQNCNQLASGIEHIEDVMEREMAKRLLRSLQNLLIAFQSGSTDRWIEAAYTMREWLQSGNDAFYFVDPDTEDEGPEPRELHEEGEEEERQDDDDVDPDHRDRDGDHGGDLSRRDDLDYEV